MSEYEKAMLLYQHLIANMLVQVARQSQRHMEDGNDILTIVNRHHAAMVEQCPNIRYGDL